MRRDDSYGLIAVVAFFAGCDSSEVTGPSLAASVPYVADVVTEIIESDITGREYQISVALPLNYSESTESYPVLYAVDANGQFGTVVETVRILNYDINFPPLLIVGIGYPVGGRQIFADGPRAIDLTPTQDIDWLDAMTGAGIYAPNGSGGADKFLQFIREELMDAIESTYRADSSDRSFYGHSFGGLFGIYALFQDETPFDRMIIGSPSLWWDNRYMFRMEEEFSQTHSNLPARVFMSVGCDEDDELHVESGGWGRMVTNFNDFVDVIKRRSYEGLVWHHMCFEDENHGSVIPATISRGLRYIYEVP